MDFYKQKSPERLREEKDFKRWLARIKVHVDEEDQKVSLANKDIDIKQWMCDQLILQNDHDFLYYVPDRFLTENFYVKVYVRGCTQLEDFPGNFKPTESFWNKVKRVDPEKYYTFQVKRQFNLKLISTLQLALDVAIFQYNKDNKVKFDPTKLNSQNPAFLAYYQELSSSTAGMRIAVLYFDLENAKEDVAQKNKGLSKKYRRVIKQAGDYIVSARLKGIIDQMELI